jgi:hypothetical protein
MDRDEVVLEVEGSIIRCTRYLGKEHFIRCI